MPLDSCEAMLHSPGKKRMNREVHDAVQSEAQTQFQTTKGVRAAQLSTFWLTSKYYAGVHQ